MASVGLRQPANINCLKANSDERQFSASNWLLNNGNSVNLTPSCITKPGTNDVKNTQSIRNINASKNEKRPRPKRGQYRKYEKKTLEEAVKSVRRGEMSVHRAGSYYGVPHSTLEYKVKERNLSKSKKYQESVEENISHGTKLFSSLNNTGYADRSENEIANSKILTANSVDE